MGDVTTLLVILAIVFIIGYDLSSYTVMRKMDPFYPKRNKWLLFGYNSFKVRQSYKRYKENGGS